MYEHVNVSAREKFCDFDQNYEEARKKLEDYHGYPAKVVRCDMEELISLK